jgi:hypothetical protein
MGWTRKCHNSKINSPISQKERKKEMKRTEMTTFSTLKTGKTPG